MKACLPGRETGSLLPGEGVDRPRPQNTRCGNGLNISSVPETHNKWLESAFVTLYHAFHVPQSIYHMQE